MKKLLTILSAILFISSNLFSQSSINGLVCYHGDTTEPIEDVNVMLIDTTGIAIDSCITDDDGLYQFNNVQDGTYIIECTTGTDPGGIDLADAHQIRWYLLGFTTFTPIQEMAADVDGDSTVTWNDYITMVVYYFAQGNPFPAGDWSFDPITYVVGNKQKEDPPPTNGTSNGDVDGSFEPGNKPLPDLLLSFDGVKTIEANEEFEIPVKINTHFPLNSLGLVFDYPEHLFNIIDVTSKQGILNFDATNGQIRMSCVNSLKNSFDYFVDPEIIVKVRAASDLKNAYNLNLILNNESHIIDSKGMRLENITLSIPNIEILDQKAELSNNYPNPFSNSTSINYKLPQAAMVTIKLYNLMGQEVTTLVDKFQNKGEYRISVNSDKYFLKPGKYIYKMSLNGNYEFSRSKIMVVL
ncbi:MAG: T9SS type A sorting domain-containing protein [Bacteroidales bacterium]|nr:T9SS type A sorting domain-containing protein [Bacteroidales bacterium]